MEKEITYINVALADDHILLRSALASLIDSFGDCKVIHQSNNGKELIDWFDNGLVPEVAILDLNMPEMDGYEAARVIQKKFPTVNVLMLTMYDSELSLIRLLQAGVKGFLKKDIHPSELKFAIHSVMNAGYYYSYDVAGKIMNLFRKSDEPFELANKSVINDSELQFLKLACTEDTYKEIAQKMKMNPRGIDNLRDHLFTKLDVKSRIGLAMYAVRQGLVTI